MNDITYEVYFMFLILLIILSSFIVANSSIYIEMYNVIKGNPNNMHRGSKKIRGDYPDYDIFQDEFIDKKYTDDNKKWFNLQIVILVISLISWLSGIFLFVESDKSCKKCKSISIVLLIIYALMIIGSFLITKKGYDDKDFHNKYKLRDPKSKAERDRFKNNYNFLIPSISIGLILILIALIVFIWFV